MVSGCIEVCEIAARTNELYRVPLKQQQIVSCDSQFRFAPTLYKSNQTFIAKL